jgi:hypothetical protein
MIGFIGLFDRAGDYNLQFTITYTHTYTSVHSHVFTSCYLGTASNGGRSPSSGFTNGSRPQLPVSRSNSSQWLNPSSPQAHSLTNSVTHQLTNSAQLTLTSAFYISARTAQKTPLHYCFAIVAVETWLLAKPLLSNACSIAASFLVLTQQRVYMPQYYVSLASKSLFSPK